jgi:hypothetical protein
LESSETSIFPINDFGHSSFHSRDDHYEKLYLYRNERYSATATDVTLIHPGGGIFTFPDSPSENTVPTSIPSEPSASIQKGSNSTSDNKSSAIVTSNPPALPFDSATLSLTVFIIPGAVALLAIFLFFFFSDI